MSRSHVIGRNVTASSLPNIDIPGAAIILAGLPESQARECAHVAQRATLGCVVSDDIDTAVETALTGHYAAFVFAPKQSTDLQRLMVLRQAGFGRPIVGLLDSHADMRSFGGFDLVYPPDVDPTTLIAKVCDLISNSNFPAESAAQNEFRLSPIFAQMNHSFLRGLADMVEDVETALQSGQWAKAQILAHSLKGSAASFDHAPLAQLAKEVENCLRLADTESAKVHFEQLRVLATSLGR